MKLAIDTTDGKKAIVFLDGRIVYKQSGQNRDTVRAVELALNKAGKKLTDITEISVAMGPGSFTGIRVGIAVARTLGLFLNVPVNGKKATEPIDPIYEKSKFD